MFATLSASFGRIILWLNHIIQILGWLQPLLGVRTFRSFTVLFFHFFKIYVHVSTIMILSFQTDRSGQPVWTQIILRSGLIRVYSVCHSICIFLTHFTVSVVKPLFSNFTIITVIFLSFRTGGSGQTVQTQIRLLLEGAV